MITHLRTLLDDEAGIAGVEYALLAAMIAIALVSDLASIGDEVAGQLEDTHVKYLAANQG